MSSPGGIPPRRLTSKIGHPGKIADVWVSPSDQLPDIHLGAAVLPALHHQLGNHLRSGGNAPVEGSEGAPHYLMKEEIDGGPLHQSVIDVRADHPKLPLRD